jgi:Tol biopolymer transport system component
MAVPFDLQRETVTGAEVPLVDDLHVLSGGNGWAGFSASNDGVLTYRPRVDRFRFAWFDAGGKELPGLKRVGAFYSFSVSPDGKRLAVSMYDEITGKADIWAYGLDRETSSRITFEPFDEHFPVWIDDHRIAYGVGERYEFGGTQSDIRLTSVDEPGQPTTLVGGSGERFPTGLAASGAMLLYTEVHGGRREIWQVAVDGSRKREPLVRAPFNVDQGRVSPNGKWLLYTSDESGRYETYVRPYGRSGGRLQVSTSGASGVWSRDGTKIFLRHRDDVLSVAVAESGDRLDLGEPQLLFSAPDMLNFAESANGRFLVQVPLDNRNPPTIVVTNWLALMNERLRK